MWNRTFFCVVLHDVPLTPLYSSDLCRTANLNKGKPGFAFAVVGGSDMASCHSPVIGQEATRLPLLQGNFGIDWLDSCYE